MPLTKGTSQEVIRKNIEEMKASGRPTRVAVAAALHTAHPNGGKDSIVSAAQKGYRTGQALAEGSMMDDYNERTIQHAVKEGQLVSHDAETQATTMLTAAQVNEQNKKYWYGR